MDVKVLGEIISRIQDTLKEYGDLKVDVKLSKNNEFGFKIDVVGLELNKLKDLENRNKRLSLSYGFTQNIVGMEFEDSRNGKLTNHRITGFKTSYRKYPVITNELNSGESYKFSVDQIRNKLGGNNQINRKANLDKLLE